MNNPPRHSHQVLEDLRETKKRLENYRSELSRRKNRPDVSAEDLQQIAMEAKNLTEVSARIQTIAEQMWGQPIDAHKRDPDKWSKGQETLRGLVSDFVEQIGGTYGREQRDLVRDFIKYFEGIRVQGAQGSDPIDFESIEYFCEQKACNRGPAARPIKSPLAKLRNAVRDIMKNMGSVRPPPPPFPG